MNKKSLKKVKTIFEAMIATGRTATSLEVKNTLRLAYPNKTWEQQDISEALIKFQSNYPDKFDFNDNGVFRTYFAVVKPKKVKKTKKKAKKLKPTSGVKRISRSKMSKLITESKGRFFTVTFVKKSGNVRVLNGNVKAPAMNPQGYINVKERNGNYRQINPRTLKSLQINGESYAV